MLNNFQLAAIASSRRDRKLFSIPLHQQLQNHLAENWQRQFNDFIDGTQEIDFNAGYHPEEHERFRLDQFVLPDWLADRDSRSVIDLDPISENDGDLDSIKGIVAFARASEAGEVILFQNFSRSHVIHPGGFLFLENKTYKTSERPGLSLEKKLSAVYFSTDAKLLFYSFRIVNTFLPLAEFYQEASEKEIREILAHDLLAPEDPDTLVANANQWFRKRFAMLRDSGILDNYTARQIKQHSKEYEVEVYLDNDKILFPSDKSKAKRLLQFLNEEIFRGAITETLYETNSKREAD